MAQLFQSNLSPGSCSAPMTCNVNHALGCCDVLDLDFDRVIVGSSY
jgi:hypothetical protein